MTDSRRKDIGDGADQVLVADEPDGDPMCLAPRHSAPRGQSRIRPQQDLVPEATISAQRSERP
jgi:hypothetical protein